MRNKIAAGLMCGMMTLGLLAGCGQKTGETTTAAGSEQAAGGKQEMQVEGNDVTTLNVWTFIEMHQNFYTTMAEKWNEQNPDKKVKLVLPNLQYDDMHNKLSLALESGTGAPDIADIELGKFPAFLAESDIKLRDLTDVIAPYKSNIVNSRVEIYSKEGKAYGLSTHVGTTVAFYNTGLLEAAGIDYTKIKTWDDFKAAGIRYHESTGKEFATAETSAQWMINLMLAQKDGEFVTEDGKPDVNNEKVAWVLNYIKEMQDAGALGVVPGGQPDNEEAYAYYNDGSYAVQIMPFWQTSRFLSYMQDLEGKVAISSVPRFLDGWRRRNGNGDHFIRPKCRFGSGGYGIYQAFSGSES